MERFASCYFCGADAQLTEHQIVPEALDPDREATAVLCPTCRRKVEAVVELVLEAAGTKPASASKDAAVAVEDTPDGGETAEEPVDDPPAAEEPAQDDAEVIDGPAVDETDGPDPLDGVSVMEYNRVMRLLQNREFPINRGEFEVVAREAYDLRGQTVGAVLDAVIARGLLVEEEGELLRPSQRSGDEDSE